MASRGANTERKRSDDGTSAMTVALRGLPSTGPISPTSAGGVSVRSVRPLSISTTRSRPCVSTYAPDDALCSRINGSPAGTSIERASAASRARTSSRRRRNGPKSNAPTARDSRTSRARG